MVLAQANGNGKAWWTVTKANGSDKNFFDIKKKSDTAKMNLLSGKAPFSKHVELANAISSHEARSVINGFKDNRDIAIDPKAMEILKGKANEFQSIVSNAEVTC